MASADTQEQELLDQTLSVLKDRELPSVNSFNQAGGVEVDGDGVVTFDAGPSGLSLSLPESFARSSESISSGPETAVFSGDGASAVVQPVGDGSARVVLTADESYSQDSTHAYEYGVSLPKAATVIESPTGGLLVMQPTDVADFPAVEEVDLDTVLPDATEVDQAELEQARQEVARDAADDAGLEADVPADMTVVASIATPWAVDANGMELETSISIEGDSLVQTVDTNGAAFPVTSDPLPLVVIALGAAARALAPKVIRAFAATTIRRGSAYTISGGYRTFTAFKRAYGTRKDYDWHHIVEQRTISFRGWDARAIHNPRNLVQIPKAVHQRCINSWMARKGCGVKV